MPGSDDRLFDLTGPARFWAAPGQDMRLRKEVFAENYVNTLDRFAAAKAVGREGSEDEIREWVNQAFHDEELQLMIREKMENRLHRMQADADAVLAQLHRIATSDVLDAFNDDGSMKQLKDIPKDVRAAIDSFEVVEYFEGRGKEREHVGYVKRIKLGSKTKALELIGRHLHLYVEKKETDNLADAIAERLLAAENRMKEVEATTL